MTKIYKPYNYYRKYTVKNLEKLLKSRDKLVISAYAHGNAEAVEWLIDIELIIKECRFSKNQLEIIRLYYFGGMTQTAAAEELGLTQQGVMKRIYTIRQRLKKAVETWGDN